MNVTFITLLLESAKEQYLIIYFVQVRKKAPKPRKVVPIIR